MKSESEIRKNIKTLVANMEKPPEEIKNDEILAWLWYCKGGISALYFVLNEPNPYIMYQGPKK